MSTTRVDSVLALSGFPPLVQNVPANWPTRPVPDKISLLWQYNYHNIYHKFSPFTNYKDNLLSFVLSDKQPFVYTFIDEAGQGIISGLPPIVQSILSTVNITQNSVNDVVRIGKFQVSSWGIQFLGAQTLLQRLQPFDETRIYNPLSVLLSTAQPMTIGLLNRPTRHIEPSLSGLVSAAGLGNFLPSTATTPKSTAGQTALSDYNTNQGKGLIRGQTATSAYATLTSTWPSTGPGTLNFTSFLTSAAAAVNKLFGSAKQPSGTKVRADEGTYRLMATSPRLDVYQSWYPSPTVRLDPPKNPKSISGLGAALSTVNNVAGNVLSIASNPLSLVGNALGSLFNSVLGSQGGLFKRKKWLSTPTGFVVVNMNNGLKGNNITFRQTGYSIGPTDKYSNVIGIAPAGSLENSDMLVQFSMYADDQYKYDSKFTDPTAQKVIDVSNNLKTVISNINSNQTLYFATVPTYSKLLSSGDPKSIGYDNLFESIPTDPSPANTYGIIKEYNSVDSAPPTLDKRVNPKNNLRFSTTFTSDGLNQVGVLKMNKRGDIEIPYDRNLHAAYGNWTKYQPYKDDLIAFFFYDIVNQKYIPFRATVKGISEGNTAFWDEIRFIGRADQLYSYNGFSRTLSFTFNVVVNSIAELLPCWIRINYLASVVKPSNYTRSGISSEVFNRFIVPPMMMITIGDLYRYQPIVIRSVNVNIPEDAIWETLNQDNSKEWSYLNGIIKNPQIDKNYGQLPREVEISLEGALLEKERAQMGGSHFGHAPRKDNWEDFLDSNGNLRDDAFVVGTGPSTPYLPKPFEIHKEILVPNPSANPNP